MNMLSVMIYAADVAQTVNILTALAIPVCGVGAVFAKLFDDDTERAVWDEQKLNHQRYSSLYPKGPDGERPSVSKPLESYARPIGIILAASIAINVVVPSATTFYAIAASEVGETILKSETAGKAVQALNSWLDRQIAGKN
jgi:hypothetical protein